MKIRDVVEFVFPKRKALRLEHERHERCKARYWKRWARLTPQQQRELRLRKTNRVFLTKNPIFTLLEKSENETT